MKIKKKMRGGGGRVSGVGGQGGCEIRIEVFEKIHKKFRWGGGVDVNAMLGLGGDVGYGGCEPRIEGIVQRYYLSPHDTPRHPTAPHDTPRHQILSSLTIKYVF